MGLFITFEGPDKAGKTTQVGLLEATLKKQGHDVLVVRAPGGTPVGEKLRELLLDKSVAMQGKTEILLFTASRVEAAATIREHLARGGTVLADRWVLSTIAYQGDYGSASWILSLHEAVVSDLVPDVMFLFDISAKQAFARKEGMPQYIDGCSPPSVCQAFQDRYESQDVDAWERVVARYRNTPQSLLDRMARKVVHVPFGPSIENTHGLIWTMTQKVLGGMAVGG